MFAESVVIKHTFLDLELRHDDLNADVTPKRGRAMTDTLIGYSSHSSRCDDRASETTSENTSLPNSFCDASASRESPSSSERTSEAGEEFHSATMGRATSEQASQSWADIEDAAGCFLVPVMVPMQLPPQMPVAMLQDTSLLTPPRSAATNMAIVLKFGEQGEHHHAPFEQAPSRAPDPAQERTSIKLSGLPREFGRDSVLQLMATEGLAELMDFLYVPVDLLTWVHYGYAFLNFETPNAAERAARELHGYQLACCENKLQVEWCQHQGLDEHVEKHRNNGVMHHKVADEYKPLLFKGGIRVEFPPPTKRLKLQRLLQELRRRQRVWQAEAKGCLAECPC